MHTSSLQTAPLQGARGSVQNKNASNDLAICFSIHVKPLKPVIKVDSDPVPSKLRVHDPAAQQSSTQR